MTEICAFCGKEVLIPFQCSRCRRYYCNTHRLPEIHQCTGVEKVTPLPTPRRYLPNCPKCSSTRTKITAVKPEFDVFRCPDCNHKWSQTGKTLKEYPQGYPQKKSIPKTRKPQTKSARGSLLVILLIISLAGNFYLWRYRFQTGYDDGFSEGYAQGIYIQGYNLRDPTYQEAIRFITSDNTNEYKYQNETYTCHDFTADFKNNAFESGLRCGYVYIELRDGAHAVIAFNTTDHGLFFMEPQDDEIVDVIVGQPYFDRTRYEINFDDTIVRYKIVW